MVLLFFSYNRLGKNADEADAEEIIDMASKASLVDQQKQVQENIHSQIKTFCSSMDDILLPNYKSAHDLVTSSRESQGVPRGSGLSFAIGRSSPTANQPGEFFRVIFLISNIFLTKHWIRKVPQTSFENEKELPLNKNKSSVVVLRKGIFLICTE